MRSYNIKIIEGRLRCQERNRVADKLFKMSKQGTKLLMRIVIGDLLSMRIT